MPVYKKCKAVYAVINLKTLKKSFRAFPIWVPGSIRGRW